jgi:hypothetical protein
VTANGAFASDQVVAKTGFIYVQGSQKLATRYKVQGAPLALIVDPDGEELVRMPLATGTKALLSALDRASAIYVNREISWSSALPTPVSSSEKKLLVVGFDDEKGELLKLLEDRRIAKYHDWMTFVKIAYRKDDEAAKKWGVTQAPTLLICDSSKENPEKNVVEKLHGKKNEAELKAAIQRALLKLEIRR